MPDLRIPRYAPDFKLQLLDGEAVIFHPASKKVVHASPSAALIWELVDGQRSVEQIIELLVGEYPDSQAEIEKDVPETLNLFANAGVVEWA
jgi:hypothetical protein